MFRELIDKLKSKKQQLQNYNKNGNDITDNKSIAEKNKVEITISSEDNIYKIEIDDYISIGDYIKKMELSEEYRILDLICNCVLWNGNKQKVNKSIYYVILFGNRLYNILFTDEKIVVDERTKIEIDEHFQKENITEERVITFEVNRNEYHYFSAKHDKADSTFYTRYYSKSRLFSLGSLDLTLEETYDEIKSVFYNLESIEGIENILDIELLKINILEDLGKNSLQRKKI